MQKILFTAFCCFISFFTVAQSTASFASVPSMTASDDGYFNTTFITTTAIDKAHVDAALQWAGENKTVLKLTVQGNTITFSVAAQQHERSAWQKLFFLLGIQQVVLPDSDSATADIEHFLTYYGL